MPRMARFEAVGTVHHVISRFVDRSWQLVGDEERMAYLSRLAHALERSDWTLLGYALMSSHVHLVLEGGAGSIGSWTKSTHARMARWLNARHGRLGPVFADRPYVETVADGRVPYLVAYVHNNPVRARLVGWAGDSTWTSHRAYLGLVPAPAPLLAFRGLERCAFSSDAVGMAAFDSWVRGCAGETEFGAGPALVQRARMSARQWVGAHAGIGTPSHEARGLTFPITVPEGTTRQSRRADIHPHEVLEVVGDLFGVDARGGAPRDRRPAITEARRAALAVWARTGQPRVLMARALGIGSSAASDLLTRRPGRVSRAAVDEAMARLVKAP